MSVLAPGSPAPAFRLARENGEAFGDGDLQGATTVLVFYPFAFAGVNKDTPHA